MKHVKPLHRYIFAALTVLALFSCRNSGPSCFYVDPDKGSDRNTGTSEKPFHSVGKALAVVKGRVERGIFSDKIYLRGGTYRKNSETTLYHLALKGTADDYALLSAMPCDSAFPGAVRRMSGRWYEPVVFDDAWLVSTPWQKLTENPSVWKTSPGYTHLEWTHQNLWPWTAHGFQLSKTDDTPETTSFTVAPYLLLQDGEPSVWVNTLEDLTEPGRHFYDHSTRILYLCPWKDADPNQSKIETWYGGDERYEAGTLHLDGEGRALFDGNLQYAAIKGLEFRMFNKIFELHRRRYDTEAERVIQQDVLFEDNECRYGWIQILLDANTVLDNLPGVIRPKYQDRARWTVRNNLFYRPSREVCQLHGDDHLFEGNTVIDHLGPWAGPAACVSAVNTRNTRNFTARNNYFAGQGNNAFHSGSVFMIESGAEHADEQGDYILGGQTYENNLIANVSSGPAFVLGKGGARLLNITLHNNIVKTNRKSPAILMGSPHKNLTIAGNIFYDQQKIIEINRQSGGLNFDSLPSSIVITGNMFVNNRTLFDQALTEASKGNRIIITGNLFFANDEKPAGESAAVVNPQFRDPECMDFSFQEPDQKWGVFPDVTKAVNARWPLRRIRFPSEIPLTD
jgi:hypothetical protein